MATIMLVYAGLPREDVLVNYLEAMDHTIVGRFNAAGNAMVAYAAMQPAIVIIDFEPSDSLRVESNGLVEVIQWVAAFKAAYPLAGCIGITRRFNGQVSRQLMALGVQEYVCKEWKLRRLTCAIDAVLYWGLVESAGRHQFN